MFLQRAGYQARGEAMATHSRRRYRLLPGNPNLGLPNPDPSLWIIHYSKANPRDHLPAASIPIMPFVQAQIQQRRMIQAQGPLMRKEFMLHDRSNWPIIAAPQGMARPGAPGQMAMPGHRRGTSVGGNEVSLEEEEDVSRGDILDFMTPREISRQRYEQHHEWMEEVLESPYNTLHIVPTDLGLGRKGDLEELTEDFFDAPISTQHNSDDNGIPRVGKMDAGKAEEFAKRANQKLADMQAELEKMKQRHAKRMEKLHRTTLLNSAEKKLRTAPLTFQTNTPSGEQSADATDEIVTNVEEAMDRKVERSPNVVCIERGGLEDRIVNPSVTNGSVTSPTKTMDTVQVPEPKPSEDATTSQPEVVKTGENSNDKETPAESALQSGETDLHEKADAVDDQDLMLDAAATGQDDNDLPDLDDIGMDVDLGMDDDLGGETSGLETNEWVMVDEEANPAATDEQQPPQPPPPPSQSEVIQPAQTTESKPDEPVQPADQKPSDPSANDEVDVQPQQQPQAPPPPQEEEEPVPTLGEDDFSMGDDFDTAGDALANYGDDDDNADDLDLDNMDDTAFGDAFQ